MEELVNQWGLLGLFISAFISSTLFPGGSEALLMALVMEASHSKPLLLITATVGNTLGGMTSWLLGYYFSHRFAKKLQHSKYRAALATLRRRGSIILLFSWLPVIGDPLCLMAGWLKIHWLSALLFILIGKFLRYLFIVLII